MGQSSRPGPAGSRDILGVLWGFLERSKRLNTSEKRGLAPEYMSRMRYRRETVTDTTPF